MELNKEVLTEIEKRLTKRAQDLFCKVDERLKPIILINEKNKENSSRQKFSVIKTYTYEINMEKKVFTIILLFGGLEMISAFSDNEAVPTLPNISSQLSLISLLAQVYLEESESFIREAHNTEKIEHVRRLKEVNELIRSAGKRFMHAISYTGDFEGAEQLFWICNEVSQLRYERKEISGNIVVTKGNNKNINFSIKFKKPILFEDTRKLRKIMELTSECVYIISDSYWVYGLGMAINTEVEPVFTITFEGKNKWQVSQGDNILMVVHDGIPNVYKDKINKESFLQRIIKAKGDLSHEQKNNIVSIAERAGKLKHGGLIVISDRAADEAMRLGNQGLPIESIKLQHDLIEQFTSIDGAILMDWDCNCYAIGVILDGITNENIGDSTRGSRYNSAARYCNYRNSEGDKVIAIVISEDGMVNVVPESTN